MFNPSVEEPMNTLGLSWGSAASAFGADFLAIAGPLGSRS